MTDNHSVIVRSYNMSRIRGKNTKPEMMVRKFLFSRGFRYRLHDKKLPGKPDIILPKYKTVIFINGCFWHGHEKCRYFVLPKSNKEYWLPKIEKNIKRDREIQLIIENAGWKVIVIWECQLKKSHNGLTLNILVDQIVKEAILDG